MAADLGAEIDNYALYLPALAAKFVDYVISNPNSGRCSVRPVDLNFLDQGSKLWTYRYCLASAGHLMYSGKSNAITQRDPRSSWVMGDSGGYQVGIGTLKHIQSWNAQSQDPIHVANLWRSSRAIDDILRWLEMHCDYAMTLDMPLWSRLPRHANSPFHFCSVELLTELTIDNLRYISDHRGVFGNCKFLNVLHGRNDAESDYWYRKVRGFDFEGWAQGGSVAASLDIEQVLKRTLVMRDEGMLGGRRDWYHVLGISQLKWAVALTAIQRAVQKNTALHFTVSFDTSTPFLWSGKFQSYPAPPILTRDIRSWKFSQLPFPVGYAAATKYADKPFPPGSPLSRLLTIGDMNPKNSPYAAQTFDNFSSCALANHNLYVFIRGFIDANKAVFDGGAVPQEIDDLIGIIADLFDCENWSSMLEAERATLRSIIGNAPSET